MFLCDNGEPLPELSRVNSIQLDSSRVRSRYECQKCDFSSRERAVVTAHFKAVHDQKAWRGSRGSR